MSSSSPTTSSCCCISCNYNGPSRNIALSCWVKPFRVLYFTFSKWWIPRICLLFYIIFQIAVAFGFRIKINQTIFDLNENISAREIMWFFIDIFWMFTIGFYVNEWVSDSKRYNSEIEENAIMSSFGNFIHKPPTSENNNEISLSSSSSTHNNVKHSKDNDNDDSVIEFSTLSMINEKHK